MNWEVQNIITEKSRPKVPTWLDTHHNSQFPGKNENVEIGSAALLEPIKETCQITRRDLPGTSNFFPMSVFQVPYFSRNTRKPCFCQSGNIIYFIWGEGKDTDNIWLHLDDSQTWLAPDPRTERKMVRESSFGLKIGIARSFQCRSEKSHGSTHKIPEFQWSVQQCLWEWVSLEHCV